MRPHAVVVIAPGADDHLSLFQAVDDLQLQALVPELCSEMAASLQASEMLLPWASCTSIWRNVAIICSGLNLFFGMGGSLVPGQLSQATRSNSTQSGHFPVTKTTPSFHLELHGCSPVEIGSAQTKTSSLT